MKQSVDIPIDHIRPLPRGVFQLQGIPLGKQPPERVMNLYRKAADLFMELAEPRGIMKKISIEGFKDVYPGIGNNESESPLDDILPASQHLALFAGTVGAGVSKKVETMMASMGKDFALGFMLDSVASFCTDRITKVAESFFARQVYGEDELKDRGLKVLLYSPGYCGWHVSGQGTLFEYLEPGEIGITLNSSFLMTPIKSVSGLLVAGGAEIHRFDNLFSFCDDCKTFNCRERMAE